MSRMLQALRQIESRRSEPAATLVSTQADVRHDDGRLAEESEPSNNPSVEPAAGAVDEPCSNDGDPEHAELAANIISRLPSCRAVAVLLTSPDDQLGPAGFVVSLGRHLCRSAGGRLLLVDADFRHPALAGFLGIEVPRGLTEVTAGEMPWQEGVRQAGAEGIDLLSCGSHPAATGRSFGRAPWTRLLDELREAYRLVLIRGASACQDEVLSLAELCDATFVVVQLGRTTRGACRKAVHALDSAGARLMGCVVTELQEGDGGSVRGR